MARKEKVYNVTCANRACGRLLGLDLNDTRGPNDSTEAERIHEVAYPAIAGRKVLCTCGHYTLFRLASEIGQ
jgi:hypothetical protein